MRTNRIGFGFLVHRLDRRCATLVRARLSARRCQVIYEFRVLHSKSMPRPIQPGVLDMNTAFYPIAHRDVADKTWHYRRGVR
jgi:hypothetical protein